MMLIRACAACSRRCWRSASPWRSRRSLLPLQRERLATLNAAELAADAVAAANTPHGA